MYKVNRRFFAVFLWLVCVSVPGIIFQAAASLFFQDGGRSLSWVHPALFVLVALSVLIYVQPKLPSALKGLLTLVFTGGGLVGCKFLVENFLFPRTAELASLPVIGVSAFVLTLLALIPLSSLYRRFQRYYKLLDRESEFPETEKYLSWLRSETTGNPKRLEAGDTGKFLVNFAIIWLAIMFVAIAVKPSSAGIQTIYSLCYGAGALGVYMLIYQMSSILKWKILGYKTEENMVKNWNVLILLMFVPLVVVPLVVPWQYQIVRTQVITEFFVQQFGKLTVSVMQGAREGEDRSVRQNETVQWTPEEEERVRQNQRRFRTTVTIVAASVASVIAFYIALGILGYVFLKRYKYARKPGWVQFLINRYFRLKSFFDIVTGLFKPFTELFARLLGLRKPEMEEEAQQLEKQLYTYFEAIKQLPQEKQEEIRTVIREFVRFIQTATRTVTPYYFFFGPMEYTEKVIDMRPTLAIDLRKIVSVFNESRYSLHLLSDDIRGDFMQTVDSVILTLERS